MEEGERQELGEIGKRIRGTIQWEFAYHEQGEGREIQNATREDIARMAVIRVRTKCTQDQILQAMGVDQAMLKNFVVRRLDLTWAMAWKVPDRRGRPKMSLDDPPESSASQSSAGHPGQDRAPSPVHGSSPSAEASPSAQAPLGPGWSPGKGWSPPQGWSQPQALAPPAA